MQITIEVPDYVLENGISYEWVGAPQIKASLEDGSIVIAANRDGLISLAGHLLNLAQEGVPAGEHMHFGDYNSLEEDSVELILMRT
jgi:hypothetical protein